MASIVTSYLFGDWLRVFLAPWGNPSEERLPKGNGQGLPGAFVLY
jgi:hypothetical protein